MSMNNFKIKTKGFLNAHKTDIACYGGCAMILAGTVLACKATLKVNAEAEEDAKKADEIRAKYKLTKKTKGGKKHVDKTNRELVELNKQGSRLLLKHNLSCIGRYCRHYSLAAALEIAGIGLNIYAHGSEKSERIRMTGLAAGYLATLKKFRDKYREEHGEEAEKKFYYGVQEETKETVDEKGKKKEEKIDVIRKDIDISDFAKFFGVDYSEAATGYPEADIYFLKGIEQAATRKLHKDHWLTLNELYKMLELRDACGQRYGVKGGNNIGWVYDKNDPDGNIVDLGIFNAKKTENVDYVNGYNDVILIEPNVNCLDLANAMWGLDENTPDPDLFRD